jgi:hypothetical protein
MPLWSYLSLTYLKGKAVTVGSNLVRYETVIVRTSDKVEQ